MFEFSSNNMIEKHQMNKEGGAGVNSNNLAQSLNSFSRAVRNQKSSALSSRVDNSKDFTCDYHKSNPV